jgi:hypothetical protein
MKKNKQVRAITKQILKDGRVVPEQTVPYEIMDGVKKELVSHGYRADKQITEPDHHYTGIKNGTTFFLWAIPPFTCNKGASCTIQTV